MENAGRLGNTVAGKSLGRFDGEKVASEKPRRVFRFCKKIIEVIALAVGVAFGGVGTVMAGAPRVENVRARQIPDTKDVEVVYDLIAPDGGLFNVSATFQAPGVAPEPKTVTGAFGQNVAPGRNRRFVWDAGIDWPDNVNSHFTCNVRAEEQIVKEPEGGSGGVQLWEGGPYWAECNVGASTPEECGLYFWWGDTVGHAGNWNFSSANCPTYGKSISELQSLGYIDSTGNLAPAHDAARAHWGSPWRMPTDAEFAALVSNCDTQWTTRNGVNGRLVKGRGAYSSKSIFLPAAGAGYDSYLGGLGSVGSYWSSAPYSDSSLQAWYLFFYSSNFYRSIYYLYPGQSVRPVRGFAK